MNVAFVDTKAIGSRLSQIRLALNLNQSQFAELMDVSPQRWGNYELGKRTPKAEILARLWSVTGASADYVLFGKADGMPLGLAVKLGLAAYR